jgi:RNA-directed DNA polymerase
MNGSDRLMEQLAAPENLLAAWRAVRGNIPQHRRQRSAGPDGVTLAEFERDLAVQLRALRQMLLQGRYRPQAPAVFQLAKPDGGRRQIAVLNVADRVAQRAAQQALEPLYEPVFLPCSFGFRPGRSTLDAVTCARRLRAGGYPWVVDGDIAACFDSLDHRLLLDRLGKRVQDERVRRLIQDWLAAGLLQSGLPGSSPAGRLGEGWQKVSGGLRRGVDWALHSAAQTAAGEPPGAARPPPMPGPDDGLEEGSDGVPGAEDDFYRLEPDPQDGLRTLQQKAVQQVVSGGLLLGAGWARQGLAKAGTAAAAALKTSAGRAALKRGLLAGGGAAGVAAGAAVAAYLVYRQMAPSRTGILQGSPLSPLLANIYLHPFDLALARAGRRLVRFADDWVILCPDQEAAEAAYNQARGVLVKLRLKVNPEKTHILPPSEKLEWLGYFVE